MKTFKLLLVVCSALALVVPGCATRQPSPPTPVDPADRAAVVAGNNAFALDLYARLRGRQGNLFFAPDSLSTALALTSAGARGRTAEEMARVLHLPPLKGPRLHAAFGDLLRERQEEGQAQAHELRSASALWGQTGRRFRDEFLSLARADY